VEDVRVQRLSLSQSFYVSVKNCVLVFYNQPEGPYRGGIIALVDDQGNAYPRMEREVGFNGLGIYYRYFRWPGTTLWTLMISILYPLAVFSILPLLWLVRRLRLRGRRTGADSGPLDQEAGRPSSPRERTPE